MTRIVTLAFAALLGSACTVQDRQGMAFTQHLEHLDDSLSGVRCYYITGLNSIHCIPFSQFQVPKE